MTGRLLALSTLASPSDDATCTFEKEEMSKLKLPFALNSAKVLVSARNSVKEDGPFTCIDDQRSRKCILRKGAVRAHHFSHSSSAATSDERKCRAETAGGESLDHLKTKFFISEHISEISLQRICGTCNEVSWEWSNGVKSKCEYSYKLQATPDSAFPEKQYRIDVQSENVDGIPAAIEVLFTHECGQEKLSNLEQAFGRNVFEINTLPRAKEEEAEIELPLTLTAINKLECEQCWTRRTKRDHSIEEARRVTEAKAEERRQEARRREAEAEEKRRREEAESEEKRSNKRRLTASKIVQMREAERKKKMQSEKRSETRLKNTLSMIPCMMWKQYGYCPRPHKCIQYQHSESKKGTEVHRDLVKAYLVRIYRRQ